MNKIDEDNLNQLFLEYKNTNSEEILEKIYLNYSKLIEKIAFTVLKNKDDSEDIVQNIFIKLHKMQKDNLPNNNVASWLYTVTKNESVSFLRTKKDLIDIDNIYQIENNNNEINNTIDIEEFNLLINRLGKKEKEIISLKILSQLSFADIAKLLNEPIGTVKWRYYKSINQLRVILSNLGMFIVTFVIGLKTLVRKTTVEHEITKDVNTVDNLVREDEGEKSTNLNNNEYQDKVNEVVIATTTEEIVTVNYYGVGFLAISLIFLIISIISFIKYQLKFKDKTSK